MLTQNLKAARAMLLVLKFYESDIGHLPEISAAPGVPAFEELMEKSEAAGYLDWPEALYWQDPRTGERIPWVFLPIESVEGSFSRRPVFISPRPYGKGKYVIAYAGGQVVMEQTDAEEAQTWQELISKSEDLWEKSPPDPVPSHP